MFAIIENKGKQYRVSKGEKLEIDRTELEEGSEIIFDNVLLLSDGKDPKVGLPLVEGATVEAKVLGNKKDKKIIVFKKKRRHNYRRKIGHRQEYTVIQISDIKLAAK